MHTRTLSASHTRIISSNAWIYSDNTKNTDNRSEELSLAQRGKSIKVLPARTSSYIMLKIDTQLFPNNKIKLHTMNQLLHITHSTTL